MKLVELYGKVRYTVQLEGITMLGCRMKQTGLEVRPMFHWTVRRIEAHVKLCVLALQIQRAAEMRTGLPWARVAHALAALKAVGLPHVWGSGRGRHAGAGIIRWHKSLSEAGTEGAVINGAANLQQEIGPSPRPAHLL
jgi:hypothetical protein